jgi:putative methylase
VDERKLALILSALEENSNPEYMLEQYSVTPEIAASTLILAKDDIKNKVVYDLGCGSGRFTIGAALLGAKKAVGVDIDDNVLEIAKENVALVKEKTGIDVSSVCEWVCTDVEKLDAKAHTVVQFPPFSLDKIFFKKALEISKKVYSIHKDTKSTRDSLSKLCEQTDWQIEAEKKFKYVLAWKEGRKVGREVFLLVAKKLKS